MGLSSIIIVFTLTLLTFTLFPMTTHSIPFVLFHGIADDCEVHEEGNQVSGKIFKLLQELSGSPAYCIEIGNGYRDSLTMQMPRQVSIACEKVKQMSELNDGYNLVGLSQGNMVARGVIEFCDGPPVKNFVSLGGPHAGVASLPNCKVASLPNCTRLSPLLIHRPCICLAELIAGLAYNDFVQEHFAAANYLRIPTHIDAYRKGSNFLPELNNEIQRNQTYKKRFESLQNLVLIMYEQDDVLVPRETSLFGFYPDGSWSPVLPAEETMLYKEDWIGLKTLNEAGKVKFINISGGHLEIKVEDFKKYIIPYLVDNTTAEPPPSFGNSRYTSGWEGEEKLTMHEPK